VIDISRVRMTGPLTPLKGGFAAELSRQGYAPGSLRGQLYLMAHLSRWLADEGLAALDLTPAVAERFLDARRATHSTLFSAKALAPLLAHLREIGAAPSPPPPPAPAAGSEEELLCRYRRFLTIERGFQPSSAHTYARAVRPFLTRQASAEGIDLEGLDAAEVIAYVVAHCPQLPRGSAKEAVTALRSFLAFLHFEGMIKEPLAPMVPTTAAWRLSRVPQRLDSEQLARLLAACERDTASGRRDFALITVLSRLGLRAGELIALELEDIDWRAGDVLIRGKEDRAERLPLPADVGAAIAAYLRRDRPPSARERAVFLGVLAPHRALSVPGVSSAVARAARRAGLGRVHAHCLRHSAASETLRQGGSLAEVGQLLRHRRPETTAIYAKVDRENLSGVARPWPAVAR
jgi:integrase/recombinase XerD